MDQIVDVRNTIKPNGLRCELFFFFLIYFAHVCTTQMIRIAYHTCPMNGLLMNAQYVFEALQSETILQMTNENFVLNNALSINIVKQMIHLPPGRTRIIRKRIVARSCWCLVMFVKRGVEEGIRFVKSIILLLVESVPDSWPLIVVTIILRFDVIVLVVCISLEV